MTVAWDPIEEARIADERQERLVRQFVTRGLKVDTTPEVIVTDPETGGKKGRKLARWDMIPPDVLRELAEHYGKGELKYPANPDGTANWQRGYDWRLSISSLQNHLNQWLLGEDTDAETGTNHLVAVIWHAIALRWFQLHGKGRDTRPKGSR
jgi:hypothetical protein